MNFTEEDFVYGLFDKQMNDAIAQGKKDIKKFSIENPHIPINEFSDLHNHFDANCFVETLFTDEGEFLVDTANEVIYQLDNYIRKELLTKNK